MTRLDHIYNDISSLPVEDRLRLVERVVQGLLKDGPATAGMIAQPVPAYGVADYATSGSTVEISGYPAASEGDSLLGLFENDSELIDEVCRVAMAERQSRPSRMADG